MPKGSPAPLSPADVTHLLSRIDPVDAASSAELTTQLLRALSRLPGVDSCYMVLLDPERQIYQQLWFGLEGELREGEEQAIATSPWAEMQTLSHPLCETLSASDTRATPPPTPIPGELSAPQTLQDAPDKPTSRCILPLRRCSPPRLVVLQSHTPELFAGWAQELLALLSQQFNAAFRTIHALENLQHNVAFHHQRLSLFPPSLFHTLHMAQSFLNEVNPIASSLQHNLDAMHGYHQRLLQALDYYRDEIKLYASEEAIQRIDDFDRHNQIVDTCADLDPVTQDAASGLFQLRYYLNKLREMQNILPNQEQFEVATLLQPLLTTLFNDNRLTVAFESQSVPPLYGNQSRLRQALTVLLLTIAQSVDLLASPPHIAVRAAEASNDVALSFRFHASSEATLRNAVHEESYLFVKRVLEEHQGHFAIHNDERIVTLTLYLPIMFDETDAHVDEFGDHTPRSFEQVGHLELPAIESTDSLQELPATYNKLLLLSNDALYARSLRRVLSRQFQVKHAATLTEMRDLLSSHSDFALLLCDLEENSEDSFEVLDELQAHDPSLAQYVCFLVGESPPPAILDFARRLTTRCCERHAPIETLQRFINRRRRV